ncbi:transaldolase [Solirubrobacter phytolaccae]|uniref:Transaldolase n=1 Tax=Solirubrobacter phytolaccae TaxID=1404360 RepID=A0A9X3NCH1_9ACTN|nr:transaldolase [Solirubrobacter phytolaccae]MDA0183923.1 transaldolase [Solirubrobacter phytolaccae]
MSTPLQQLAERGQSVWIDFLSRTFVKDGDLKGLVEQGVEGVTSNPTIFQGAIAEGDAYDDQIRELSAEHDDAKEIFWQLAKDDIRDACDILRPVWDKGKAQDGWVSLEVDPNLAHDTDKTKSEAIRLFELVDRPNLLIKIPATLEGLQAIEDTVAGGIPVNVTLIFSLERHRAVAEAYVRGVQRLVDGGGDPKTVASVASFFVSRVDTEADKRLKEIGGHDDLLGKLAIANAKLAYQTYEQVFSSPEWKALEAKGATKQRCLWASTGVKNPDYKDTVYVEELVGPDTVNTMPRELVEAVLDHGDIRGDTILDDTEEASRILDRYESAGVSYDDVVQVLEREGVEKFAKSFADLIEGLETKLKTLVAA